MTRPSKDEYFIRMAELVATRSTCVRRAVGCVLVDRRGHVLATGYNGVAAGMPHCNEESISVTPTLRGGERRTFYPNACPGACDGSGVGLESCEAIHAEDNALLQCPDPWAIDTVYVTVSPCVSCTKKLLNTSARRVVFRRPYAHDEAARELWLRGRAGAVGHDGWVDHGGDPFIPVAVRVRGVETRRVKNG